MTSISKMDGDIKDVVKRLVQGNEKRKKRLRIHRESAFDIMAANAIEDALNSSCRSVTSPTARKHMQERIYRSIVYSISYEYIGDVHCGRRQFYDYRNEFILAVADKLGMVPPKEPDSNEAMRQQELIGTGDKAGQN